MSLTTGEMSAADLAAVVGNSGNGNGWGFGGDGGWWIILLFLCLFGNGGWGNGYGGGNNGGAGGLYPWMNQAEITSDGFRDQMLNSNITSIRDGINGIQTQLCNGFSDVQMSAMQNAFGLQGAINSGVNGLQSQLAQCCCDNRLATCQTQNIIQSESAATRFADANNTRDIIQSQSNGTQAILDKLCQLELDGVKAQVEAKNDRIADLQRQLSEANLSASQTAQNAFIAQGFSNEVDALYNRLSNCPVPTTPVYGRTPIFTCNQNSGCGCNGNFYN
jgi:hypothetical protein